MEMAGKTAGIGRNQPELAGTDRTLLDLARSRRTGAVREEQQRRPRPDLGRPEQLKECGGAARTGMAVGWPERERAMAETVEVVR